jgi:hypothetical protein
MTLTTLIIISLHCLIRLACATETMYVGVCLVDRISNYNHDQLQSCTVTFRSLQFIRFAPTTYQYGFRSVRNMINYCFSILTVYIKLH